MDVTTESSPSSPLMPRFDASKVAGNISRTEKERILRQNYLASRVPDRWGYRLKKDLVLVAADVVEQSHGSRKEAVLCFELDVQPYMCNAWDVCHGGMISTLLDFSTSVAIPALLTDEAWQTSGLTLSLNINFLSPAIVGDKLRVVATTKSCGGRTASVNGELWSSRGLVATASHIKMLPHGKIMKLPKPT